MLLRKARGLARVVDNLPIGVKAALGSAFMLLCLIGLGTHAVLVMDGLSSGLRGLTTVFLPKQQTVFAAKSDAVSIHVNVYRYVAWSSSGVNRENLEGLASDIRHEANDAHAALAALARRGDLSPDEQRAAAGALVKWRRYSTAVADTLDIAATDPALGTMMLGGTDEDYKQVAAHLDAMAESASTDTTIASRALVGEADRSKFLIAGGGLLALLLAFTATVVVIRSVVKPIAAVTRALNADAVGKGGATLAQTERRDEIGQMVNAIAMFRDQIARDNRLLAAREQDLAIQNARFNAALNNMSQGLVMFDADRRLIVCNAKYTEMYHLPPELTKPGTTQVDILRHRIDSGIYEGTDPDAYIESRVRTAAAERDSDSVLQLSDGRTIAVAHRVMPGGGWVSTHEDATERFRAEQRIAHMARHDALTGLPNRLLFREEMEHALAHAARGETVAILCIDLDHFKEVNDTLGHPAGDELLVMVADRLRQCVRRTDTIARLGGDEFAVIQRSLTRIEEVAIAARRIVETLCEPYRLDGHATVIGTSIGIALAADGSASADQLLRNADVALYRAKNEGRGMYCFFEPDMDVRLQARHKLETDLRGALARNELALDYQPVIDVGARRVIGFEALVRWHHPDRGTVLPGDFIPVAEETGLIEAIGDWVLQRACADASRWPKRLHVAVNLSPVQFRSREIIALLVRALAASGLDPGRLELEITESVLMRDNEATIATMHELRGLGVRMSLDDFGTGYSSLSYLLRYPFDKIKIDRSFVKEVLTRPESAAIVRAVVSLAAGLSMTTTAEGVETEEQFEHLRAEGCEQAQGFLFSAALPVSELDAYLAANDAAVAARDQCSALAVVSIA